jgi:hypothetical protein
MFQMFSLAGKQKWILSMGRLFAKGKRGEIPGNRMLTNLAKRIERTYPLRANGTKRK